MLLISLYTAPCADGQLRLAGGNIPNEGRVEICANNEWGTVCGDSWGSADAAVVCRQLGYPTQSQWHLPLLTIIVNIMVWLTFTDAVAFSTTQFGAGTGPILLDDVDCSGSENNLTDCSRSSFGRCYRSAGVRCQGRYMHSSYQAR